MKNLLVDFVIYLCVKSKRVGENIIMYGKRSEKGQKKVRKRSDPLLKDKFLLC